MQLTDRQKYCNKLEEHYELQDNDQNKEMCNDKGFNLSFMWPHPFLSLFVCEINTSILERWTIQCNTAIRHLNLMSISGKRKLCICLETESSS